MPQSSVSGILMRRGKETQGEHHVTMGFLLANEEVDKFLETYNLSILNQEQIETLNRPLPAMKLNQ